MLLLVRDDACYRFTSIHSITKYQDFVLHSWKKIQTCMYSARVVQKNTISSLLSPEMGRNNKNDS